MPATHSPTPARSWIVRLARVCWERKKLSIIVVVASVSTILLAALTAPDRDGVGHRGALPQACIGHQRFQAP